MKDVIGGCFAGQHAAFHLEARGEVGTIPAKSLQIMDIEEFDLFAKRRINLRMLGQVIKERSGAAFHHADHKKIRQDAQGSGDAVEEPPKKEARFFLNLNHWLALSGISRSNSIFTRLSIYEERSTDIARSRRKNAEIDLRAKRQNVKMFCLPNAD